MVELMGGLIMKLLLRLLLSMMGVVILVLELGHLHRKPLMRLSSIQHGGMLSLVALAIHAVCIGIEN
jgi:hypothetical protein